MLLRFWCNSAYIDSGFFFFKQKTAYEMRISDWSSDVCSSDLPARRQLVDLQAALASVATLGAERRWITLRMEGRSVAGLLTRSARLLPFLLKRGAGPLVGDVERLSQDLRQRVVHRHVACQVTKHLSRVAKLGRASCRDRIGQYV